ncbi:hypothetical protein GJ496_001966 [Pomphorhynchus laevis]|nr:hypothetical protein GJ496_001966 [Pomphorhynchus laevis]
MILRDVAKLIIGKIRSQNTTLSRGDIMLLKNSTSQIAQPRRGSPAEYIRGLTLKDSIDFEKWNTNMRDDLVVQPFRFMDNLFRFEKLISRTHEVFTNSLIYTSDKEYLQQWESTSLDSILNDYTWSGHLGGFEGLRQSGYTIITVATIRLVSKETKIPIKIMGQGDNPIQDLIMSQSSLQPFDIELPLVNGEPTLGISRQ